MESIRNTTDLVKESLISNPKTRDSDTYLYYVICKAKLKAKGINIDSISFKHGLLHRSELGLPNFETVRRARQKIQHDNPELAGSEAVEEMRAVREESFRNFARGVY